MSVKTHGSGHVLIVRAAIPPPSTSYAGQPQPGAIVYTFHEFLF